MNIFQYVLALFSSDSICTTEQAVASIRSISQIQVKQQVKNALPVPATINSPEKFSYKGFRPYH